MKRVLLALAAVVLVAATPEEAIPGLEANGYYIEPGSSVSEQVVSDAVFEGRADGGRLYFVVLADEPPGGAPTFSDSVLDLLDVEGYVVTVSPETVGWAGEGTTWTEGEMNYAVTASLDGASDDEVVELFISELTGVSQGSTGGSSGSDGGSPDSSGGGISIVWIMVAGAVGVAIWMFVSRRGSARRTAQRLDEIRDVAKGKLDEIANDILEMENEVAVSGNAEVKEHYQRASAMYTKATEDNQRATTIREMLDVTEELDLAIWELDCAEALLDGKPKPPKPEPPAVPAPTPPRPPAPIPEGGGEMPPVPGTVDQYDRRPQRQSSGSSDLMTMLMTMMAMGGMRGGGGFGGWGGGSGGGMGGGGFRTGGGGGRMRGGGRRG